MEKIKYVTEEDVGRIASSECGTFRVKLLSTKRNQLGDYHVEYLESVSHGNGAESGDITENFRLVGGAHDMYWEALALPSTTNIWFEGLPAIHQYGTDVVKDVMKKAFNLAPNKGSPWVSFEDYFSEWGDTLGDPNRFYGIDFEDDWNGVLDQVTTSDGEILSFAAFAERLGIEIEKNFNSPFSTWCRENGYDPKGQFMYNKSTTKKVFATFSLDAVLTLKLDDGSGCPGFVNQDGDFGYEYYDKQVSGGVVLVPYVASAKVAKPRFRKTRQKPPVRQKTDVVIHYLGGKTYTVKGVSTVSLQGDGVTIQKNKVVDQGISQVETISIAIGEILKLEIKSPEDTTQVHLAYIGYVINDSKTYCVCTCWSKEF